MLKKKRKKIQMKNPEVVENPDVIVDDAKQMARNKINTKLKLHPRPHLLIC